MQKAGNRGHGQNIVAAWPKANNLSLCCQCHPANGAFDSRDTLVHAISLNILAEVSKEVKTNGCITISSINGKDIDYIIYRWRKTMHL